MMHRLAATDALALVLAACAGGAPGPTVPGVNLSPGATAGLPTVPPAGTPNTQPGGGTPSEAMVRALVPPGSTEVNYVAAGGSYTLYVSNSSGVDQIEAFYDQAIPAQGIIVAGKSEASGSLVYSLTNPIGGVVVTPAATGHMITISLGSGQ